MKPVFTLLISCLAWSGWAQTDCEFTAQLTAANCNDQKGRIELTAVTGMPPFQYEWSENAQTKNNAVAKNLRSGTYMVTILDAAACVFSDTFMLAQASEFAVRGALLPTACEATTGGVQILVDSPDNDVTYLYSITNSIYFFDNTFENIPPGSHTLYAKTDDDCVDSTQFNVPFPEPLVVDLGQDYIMALGDSLQLDAYDFDDRFVTFSWSPATGLSCADCPRPTVSVADNTEFTLTVTDSLGCQARDRVKVFVQKERNIYIPTAFSPNNDGINDAFYVFAGEGVTELRDLKIYGRWGNLVHQLDGTFAANDYRLAWNGRMLNRPAATGEYVYQFTAVFLDGEEILYQGIVKLLR